MGRAGTRRPPAPHLRAALPSLCSCFLVASLAAACSRSACCSACTCSSVYRAAAAGEGRGHGQERCCVRGMAEHAPQRLPSQQPQPTPRAKPLPPPTLALSSAARALVSLTEALPAWCASSSLAAPATTVRRSCTRAARFLQLVGWWDDDAWDDACLAQHIRETAGAARPSQPRYARPPPHVLRAPDLQHRLPQVLGDVLVVANLPLPQQLGRGVL